MKRSGAALAPVLLILFLTACSPAGTPRAPAPPETSAASAAAPTPTSAGEPVRGDRRPVPADLRRLAHAFIAYALERTDTLPTAESVWIGLDGRRIKAVDGMPDSLTDRRIWRVCPGDVEAYAAFSCPLDLLSPLQNARRNDLRLVLGRDVDVLCARSNIPAPRGRYVVIRPAGPLVSCANNFALVLQTDDRGRLTEALLTVSEP